MTPKEKAKELIKKYWNRINDVELDSISWNQAKQCALICIDEILYVIVFDGVHSLDYWHEVKQEIEKL